MTKDHKMEKTKDANHNIRNWLLATGINTIILVLVMLLTETVYSSDDDFYIAKYIVDGYPYVGFNNYYLDRVLIAIQSVAGGVNVYILFLIAVSFISLVFITKIVFDASERLAPKLIMVSALIVFSYDHYCTIQFTKVSALVMTVGYIALTDSVIRKKPFYSYVAAFIFVYIGVATRNKTLPAVLGIALVSWVVWMFIERKKCFEEEWIKPGSLAKTALIVIVIAGTFGFVELSQSANLSTPELRTAAEYSLHRSNIVDYPTFAYYDQVKEEYDAIGISENDMFLIDKWRFDYDGAASLENLKKIDSIERPVPGMTERAKKSLRKTYKYILSSVKDFSTSGIHIIFMVILAAGMMITLKPRHWLYIFAIGGTTVALYVALYYIQRANYRVMYIADIGAVLWLIYYYASNSRRNEEDFRGRVAVVFGILLLVVSAAFSKPLLDNCHSKYERTAGTVMSEDAEQYLKEHKDTAYVWATYERKRTGRYIEPFLAPDESEDNVFETGGWETMSPYTLDRLSKFGMTNPIKDLIDNDNAFYIGNKHIKQLEKYLTERYAKDGESVRMVEVDKIDGLGVRKVIREKN